MTIIRYPPPVDLNRYRTHKFHIPSADELPRDGSEPDWRPTVADLMIEDDELYHMAAGVWFPFVNHGQPGQHYVMRDDDECIHTIETTSEGYELTIVGIYGPVRCHDGPWKYPNPYDAFWDAEQLANLVDGAPSGYH